jgi:all-trans-retinol 13,14-reductase
VPPQSTGHLSLFIRYTAKDLERRSANSWIFPGPDHARNVTDYNRDPEHVAFPAVFVSFPSTKDPSRRDAEVQTCHLVAQVPFEVFSSVLETEGRPRRRNRAYENLKQAFADRLFALIEREFPALRSVIHDTDVIRGKQCSLGTPISNAHYLGSVRGSSYGVVATAERFRSLSCQVVTPVPGLYQGGQDVVSAGVTGAMMGGFFAALCASPWPMVGLWSKVGASNRRILRDL